MLQNVWKTAISLLVTLQFSQAWELVCYNGSISDYKRASYENASQLITSGYFNISRRGLVYIYGYQGSLITEGTDLIITAYLKQSNLSVCAVDWKEEANAGFVSYVNFPLVATLAERVANQLALAIQSWYQNGMDPAYMHLIGLSLGAHVAGNCGRRFTALTNKTIAWVTGLDPAKPGFDGSYPIYERIDKTSGNFVDIITTDPNRYGMSEAVGHVNIYPNPIEYEQNGVQPGCPAANVITNPPLYTEGLPYACSHRRSLDLYIDSLTYDCQLLAMKADNATVWASAGYASDQVTCFGESVNKTYRGNFYLRTNGQSPYGLGQAGTRPS